MTEQEYQERIAYLEKALFNHGLLHKKLSAALTTSPEELKDIYMGLKEQTVTAKLCFLMVELRRRAGLPEES